LDNKEYKFSAPARKYLEELVTEQKSGSSTYKVINGVNYDRKVLDKADHLSKDGNISLEDAKLLWKDVEDGPGVTETEKRTIEYIAANKKLTEGAKKFFEEKIASWAPKPKKEPKKAAGKRKRSEVPLELRRLADYNAPPAPRNA